MGAPLFLIITGPPCSGKTTIGRRLAADLNLPYFSKDGIKERLWDGLGIDRQLWSPHLGIATYILLPYLAEVELSAGRSLIIEANFYPTTTAPLQHVLTTYPSTALQICCTAPDAILIERSRQRERSGSRHAVHAEPDIYESFDPAEMKRRNPPLDLDVPLIEVDMSMFDDAEYQRLLRMITGL
jgi:predicted kinase